MINFRLHGCYWLAATSLLVLAGITSAAKADDEGQLEIKDLHFGETLYHFYQQKYFTAISDLLVAQKKYPIKTQGKEPELLLGGLYLSYNMSQPAEKIFSALTKDNIDKSIQSSAWYYLARAAYLKGQFAKALSAGTRVDSNLPSRYNDEFLHLHGNILLQQKKYKEAVKLLANFSGTTEWSNYAKFNMAIALIMSDEYQEGISLLEEVAQIDTNDVEQIALKDKANLALGYSALRAKQHDKASEYFKQIRIAGSQSNKALLGIGWALHKENKLDRALVPWLELRKRSTKDPSVQEALLTIPYALEGLKASQTALAYYNDAINAYDTELKSIDKVIKEVKSGEFISALRAIHLHQKKENHLHYTTLPDSVATPYLKNLIAEQKFQSILKDYRELLHMKNVLSHWGDQIPAYRLMLNEREKAYKARVPKIKAFLKDSRQNKLLSQYKILKSKSDNIENNFDALALANDKELKLLERLDRIKRVLDKAPQEDTEAQRNQYRLYRGLIYWDIASDFNPRLWQVKRELIEADRTFSRLNKTKHSSLATLVKTPKYFSNFGRQISDKQKSIKDLSIKITRAINSQESLINRMAIDSLKAQKHLIENYHIRASYSLTRLYDNLAALEKKK